MSTKKTTTTDSTQHQTSSFNNNYKFDPTGMSLYQASNQNLRDNVLPQLQSMSSNPFNNQWFNTNLQQGNQYASQIGSRNMQNVLAAARQQGIDQNSAAGVALMQRQLRNNSGMQSQSWLNAVNQAHNDMTNALNLQAQIASMHPLTTGESGTSTGDSTGHSTQVQQTSGLGTWLPAVAGIGMSALGGLGAAGMLGSGVQAGMSGAGSGFSGAMGGMLSGMSGIQAAPQMGAMPVMSDNYGYGGSTYGGSPNPFSMPSMTSGYGSPALSNITNSNPFLPTYAGNFAPSYNPMQWGSSPFGY